jgi:hypothetical protein
MIHPSTMAGPNWFTGSFGTTNPFQQPNTPFFRNTPFAGSQGGFTPGSSLFQNPTFGFGTNPSQIQNAINEISRQAIPTVLASFGLPPNSGYQTPFGFSSPMGFQNTSWSIGSPITGDWQNGINEMIRQTTNQAFQSTLQQTSPFYAAGTTPFTGTPGTFGTNWQQQNVGNLIVQICQQACIQTCQTICQAAITCANVSLNAQNLTQGTFFSTPNTVFGNNQQQSLWNFIGQICQQACQQACQTICQAVITCANALSSQNLTQGTPFTTPTAFGSNQQQSLWNFIGQICQQACTQTCQTICQAVITCANALSSQNQAQGTPFTTSSGFGFANNPFTVNNATQYGATTGIPAGAGAF